MGLFGKSKKNAYTALLTNGKDLEMIPSEKKGMTVSYEYEGTSHNYIAPSGRTLRHLNKPCWVLPQGKAEPMDLYSPNVQVQSALTDLTVDELIGNSYIRQFLEWMKTASTLVAQNWMIVGGIVLIIGGILWVNNTIDHVGAGVNDLKHALITPTPQPSTVVQR